MGEERAVEDHSRALMAGLKPWAYSLPQENGETRLLPAGYRRKVLVCLSSPDENFAAEFLGVLPTTSRQAFPDQLAWIRWIRDLAKQYPDVLFWIRPHPRLYPNKREGQKSELAEKLAKEQRIPSPRNFYWPDQAEQGSVWQHLANTDLLFNAWSTLADEFGKHGIPVLTFFPSTGNSQRLVDETSGTARGYEKLFRHFLKLGKSEKGKIYHFRWLADYLCSNIFTLPKKPTRLLRWLSRLQFRLNRHEKKLWCLGKSKPSARTPRLLTKILISEL